MKEKSDDAQLSHQTTKQVEQTLAHDPPPVVFLVLGATEAHGPHLPLSTDTVIGTHLARQAAALLERQTGVQGRLAPPFLTTAATCASGFPGTVSVSPQLEKETLETTLDAWLSKGVKRLCLVTLHFDPDHLQAVTAALEALGPRRRQQVHFVDFTRREHAKRIGGEFATGDCHAGAFETSLMLAAAPHRVDPVYKELPPKKVGLVKAIQSGTRSFQELGMDSAYCGQPAEANVAQGEELFGRLSAIVLEACRTKWNIEAP